MGQRALVYYCLLTSGCCRICFEGGTTYFTEGRLLMAKSQDKKRTSEKKKAQKSLKEKRADKKAKKADKAAPY